ncbi:putative zinc alcohol dehydrogenase [Viridothelium virens]|uniref:Putative zinc alcohol dehydrogenase n=1 Tax=Viridothelium virens TaxID=1048519 RepID=A0A6A6HKK0_VIRVR|nr:putative zinc alcohol dehydrogenase [Viridothelium virens]
MAEKPNVPSKMKAAVFTSASGGIEKNMKIDSNYTTPSTAVKPDQVLVEVISTSLNVVDYNLAEMPMMGKYTVAPPAVTGLDFAGRVVAAGSEYSSRLKPSQLVYGRLTPPTKAGVLAQYVVAPGVGTRPLPEGIDFDQGAAVGTTAITAYQSVVHNCKSGDKVYIHGGSGGTGTFGIQFAKANGCHVTTCCSTPNVELCKELGADEVIDYKTTNLLEALKAKGSGYFNLVVDNIGTPDNLYKAADSFLSRNGKYVQVGAPLTMGGTRTIMSRFMRPGLLGGGKSKYEFYGVKMEGKDFDKIAEWFGQGKFKPVIDSTYEFNDVAKAFERLKTGRARGKVIVHVQEKP